MLLNYYSDNIIQLFKANENPRNAVAQSAYMKNKFVFFGLTSPQRKELLKVPFAKANRPKKNELEQELRGLWNDPHRECQYAAQELFMKFHKELERTDIELIEFMVLEKSWWDTVDFIASNLIGSYFTRFPDERDHYLEKWLNSGNMWLQRCTLLFQLKYKSDLDANLLSRCILELKDTKEFFLNKAIGWALRQHSKEDPEWVGRFIENTQLSNLSVREGSKYL